MPLPSWPSGGRLSKPLVPLIAAVVVVGMGALIWSQLQQVKQLEQQLRLSQQQVDQLEGQNQELTQKLSALEGQRKNLDERVAALRQELASATASLEHSRASLDELQGRYEDMKAGRAKLETVLENLTGERDETRKRLQQVETEKAEVERSVVRLRERLAMLDRDYRQMADQLTQLRAAPRPDVNVINTTEPTDNAATSAQGRGSPAPTPSTVELPPIVVRKDQAGLSMPVRGRIVEVNEPHQFIVVDKGSVDGVHMGMSFDIVRGANTVGRATVVRVRPQLSACDIVRTRSPGPIQVGDAVVQSGP